LASRPIHFELPVDDFKRAADFYRKVFGWEITSWPGEAMVNPVVKTTDEQK